MDEVIKVWDGQHLFVKDKVLIFLQLSRQKQSSILTVMVVLLSIILVAQIRSSDGNGVFAFSDHPHGSTTGAGKGARR